MKKTNYNFSTTEIANIESKYYIVTAKCGHVRKANYMPIDFPVIATSGKEAAAITRLLPRVKHDHKDAILHVHEVSREEYLEQTFINKHDPFLIITNRRDHATLERLFEHRIQPESDVEPYKSTIREDSNKIMRFGKDRIRNPKKWARMNKAA